ncbi:low temperature requirement protein A [Micromonospora inositola]|uniref:Low temperature requirement protein LtrA n=1 Tax=Micromonospora inositola TaxID=47865 RepID=A0A1C5JWX0_9ACTN|nr:low temperature requirement protein A [Micromonospora inositola]SCG74997.1 Low temperature requirement protein LtrA [Micromonospora inositola]
MTRNRSTGLLRSPGDPQQPAFLELFFDLAFVFALTQLSHGLIEDLSWNGAFQTLVLLLAVWWVWSLTATIIDRLNPQRSAVQLLVIATMVGSLVMAVAVPDAFGDTGLIFAGAYVAIQVGRGVTLLVILRDDELRRAAVRILVWSLVSAAPWIIGAVAEDAMRGALWALAVAVDYTAGLLRYPRPGLGPSPEWQGTVAGEHLAERYRQVFIIALGEDILVTGLALSSRGFAADRTMAFLVSIATTVLVWRIYLHRAGASLAEAIAAAPAPRRLARSALMAHLLMVAGIMVTAVGDELLVAHPFGHTQPSSIAVILGGPALFVLGRATFEYAVFGRVSRDRPIGLLVLAALAPATLLGPPLLAALASTAVLAGIAVTDAVRDWERQPAPPRR